MAIFFSDLRRGREPTSTNAAWADDGLISAFLGYERRLRCLRAEIFDEHVINDASWPLLQDLFTAHLDGRRMRTKQLCAISGLPQTTVLRYLDHFEKFDVIKREDDPDDSRVTLVSITEAGAFWMREYYTNVIRNERELERDNKGVFSLEPETADRALPRRMKR
jgi:DNA-binding MarR family transcriptional regulator